MNAPANAELLEQAPVRVIISGWRLHHRGRDPEFYFRGPGKFIPAASPDIGLLYLAEDPATAVGEFLAGLKIVSRQELESRVVSGLVFSQPLRLFDATSPRVFSIGLSREVTHSNDYSLSQDWASRIQQAGFDGVAFSPTQTRLGSLFGIFGKAGTGTRTAVIATIDISERIIGDLGIRVLPISSSTDLDTID